MGFINCTVQRPRQARGWPDFEEDPVLRVVVIDDEADLRLLARYMIEDGDPAAQVIAEACTAAEALALIPHVLPDIAIVDIHLPDMDGVDLIQMLRNRQASIRLVAYSSDDLALADAIRAGADRAVLKSGKTDELLKALVA
jgi:two-component system response regulator DevR